MSKSATLEASNRPLDTIWQLHETNSSAFSSKLELHPLHCLNMSQQSHGFDASDAKCSWEDRCEHKPRQTLSHLRRKANAGKKPEEAES